MPVGEVVPPVWNVALGAGPSRRSEPPSALFCVFLCGVHVCSREVGHRGGGHLAGTDESGGVQRHLQST